MQRQKVTSDPTLTRGRRALLVLLEHETQEQVARVAGVSQASVSYWAKGAWRPLDRARRRLHEAYGDDFAPEMWMTRTELADAAGSITNGRG